MAAVKAQRGGPRKEPVFKPTICAARGHVLAGALGIALAVGIVHSRAMDMSVMPWIITSQTIPILAIAPMIIVVLNSIGISGVVPKAIIAAYLSFFPVVVGMVRTST